MEDLKQNPFAQWEDRWEPLVPTATLQIYQEIERTLNERKDGNIFRASAASMCVRRRWYQKNGYKGTPLTPRKIINFMLGDLSERTLQYFINAGCVGHGKLYSEVIFGTPLGEIKFQGRSITLYAQDELSFEIGGLKITGHADGFGKRNVDGKWELLEIKSSSDYGFEKFKEEGPGDYMMQVHALMQMDRCAELGIKEVRFFFLKKQTGHIWDRVFKYNDAIADTVRKGYILTSLDVAPADPFGFEIKKGKKTIGFPCTYCPFIQECKGDFTIEWKSNKPNYIFKENTWIGQKEKSEKALGSF